MTRPRSKLIVLERTPYYHCIARCVRRAFLCGQDSYTGESFEHRKEWVVARLRLLEQAFAIDLAAYAIMSNHYHLVLHVNKTQSEQWGREEVIRRWLLIHKGPVLAQRYQQGDTLTTAELDMLDQAVAVWRDRLTSISCFMARLNEYIARRANQEDGCKGRFWEGRFVSRGLVDAGALLSCMAYVDLNPIRAGIVDSLPASSFTSIQQRLQNSKFSEDKDKRLPEPTILKPSLMNFKRRETDAKGADVLPLRLENYIELVSFSARFVQRDQHSIVASPPEVLSQLGLDQQEWLLLSLQVQRKTVGMLNALDYIGRQGKRNKKQGR